MTAINRITPKVDRIDIADLDATTFRRLYQKPGRPLIVTGALKRMVEWSTDYLTLHLGDNTYAVRDYGEGKLDLPKRQWRDYSRLTPMTLRDYVGRLQSGEAGRRVLYLAQAGIGGTVPGETLRPSMDTLALRTGLKPIPANDINLWLGPSGHREPLHFDPGDSSLVMLRGAKTVALFPPSQSENLYPSPMSKGPIPFWVAQVDIEHPELDVFPRLDTALRHRIDVTVEQGEILYIPAFWWHEVAALGDDYVCSVNRFWQVAPLSRVLCHSRAAALWSMSRVPWQVVTGVDKVIRTIREKQG